MYATVFVLVPQSRRASPVARTSGLKRSATVPSPRRCSSLTDHRWDADSLRRHVSAAPTRAPQTQ